MRGQYRRRVKRFWKKRGPWIKRNLLALAIAGIHSLLFMSPLATKVEPQLLNVWYSFRGKEKPPEEVIVVSVDEESYRTLGLSTLDTWPREMHSKLLARLAQYKAKRVMLDFVFQSEITREGVDSGFVEALKKIETVIGKYYVATEHTNLDGEVERNIDLILPRREFVEAAYSQMTLNAPVDDGLVRRFFLGDLPYPDRPPVAIMIDGPLPSYPKVYDFIRYYGPPGTLKKVSYSDIVQDTSLSLAPYFKDKLVFVGAQLMSVAGIARKDSFNTPVSAQMMFGVEIHATSAANILRQEWIRRAEPDVERGLLNGVAFLLMMGISLLTPLKGVMLAICSFFVWACISYYGFLQNFFIPGVTLMVGLLPILLLGSTFYYYLVLRKSYEGIEHALGVQLHLKE